MEDIIKKDKSLSFEDFKHQNGMTYWWASDLMRMLGYDDFKVFRKVIDKAIKAFMSLKIDHFENINPCDNQGEKDFKLTRFACYIIAMNADPKKVEVAHAQVYFAEQTRRFELYVQDKTDMERLLIRDEISEGNKSLSSVAKMAGVENYAKFQNAGYLGMYNMYNFQLAKRRDIDKGKLLETMGRTELAANLFRITQTEERIKSQGITGQDNLEKTHYNVGRTVRNIIIENTGMKPENMPQGKEIPQVKKELKEEFKNMKKIDKTKK